MFESMGFLFLCIAAIVSLIFGKTNLSLILGSVALVFFLRAVRNENADVRRIAAECMQTKTQLQSEVVAVQKLAMVKLTDATDEIRTQVAETVAAAAMHLGPPDLGGRRVHGLSYLLDWNKEGLRKVTEARQMVEGYSPAHHDSHS